MRLEGSQIAKQRLYVRLCMCVCVCAGVSSLFLLPHCGAAESLFCNEQHNIRPFFFPCERVNKSE